MPKGNKRPNLTQSRLFNELMRMRQKTPRNEQIMDERIAGAKRRAQPVEMGLGDIRKHLSESPMSHRKPRKKPKGSSRSFGI